MLSQPRANRIQVMLDAQLTRLWFGHPVNGVFSLSSRFADQHERLAIVLKQIQLE